MVAKENQPTLKQDIEALFARASASTEAPSLFKPAQMRALGETPHWNLEQDSTLDLGHGRLERRTLRVLEVPPCSRELWPHVEQVWQIERRVHRSKTGKTSCEVVVGVTSLSRPEAGADALQEVVRAHWGIENRSHWIRDVVWQEDQCRARTGALPQVLASFRNLAMPLLRRICPGNVARATRICAAQPHKAFNLLLRTE